MTPAEGMPKEEGDLANELCAQCGHNWDAHRLCGYGSPPTEGWMECPVEGCQCRKTWSLSPEVAAQVKAQALSNGEEANTTPAESIANARRKPAILLLAAAVLLLGGFVIFKSFG